MQEIFQSFKPNSEWTRPKTFPDLSKATSIAIDVETRDPNLQTLGPGAVRNDGELVGVAIAVDGFQGYYPVAHAGSRDNFKLETIRSWLNKELGRKHQVKVGANIIYDLEFLLCAGIKVVGPVHDIQHMEALIDEESPIGYSLDALARKYLGYAKDETLLREAASAYGVDPKSGLWQLDPIFVGQYAETDAALLLPIREKQLLELKAQGLEQIHDLEMRVLPVLLAMRMRGVRIDKDRAMKQALVFEGQEVQIMERMEKMVGFKVNPWSGAMLAAACNKLGIPFPMTSRGNPSFTDETLRFHEHEFMQMIKKVRSLNKLRKMFIEDMIVKFMVGDRIHAQFHQMKGDENGTRTGRLASSNPNLQQIPKRDEELGPIIRSLYIPESGCKWAKLDYAQQEPRLMVHYGYVSGCSGVSNFVEAYRSNPKMDFYEPIVRATGAKRRDAKDMALGRCYGMGKNKMAMKLNTTVEHAVSLLADFDRAAPFIRELAEKAATRAAAKGFIRTILGRRRHFNLWEPTDAFDRTAKHEVIEPLPKEAAQEKWPNIRRFGVHKALNSLIQGSAADMMKMAMVQMYEKDGVVPHLTVHDEIGESTADEEYTQMLVDHMENAVKLEIPIVCEAEVNDTWSA